LKQLGVFAFGIALFGSALLMSNPVPDLNLSDSNYFFQLSQKYLEADKADDSTLNSFSNDSLWAGKWVSIGNQSIKYSGANRFMKEGDPVLGNGELYMVPIAVPPGDENYFINMSTEGILSNYDLYFQTGHFRHYGVELDKEEEALKARMWDLPNNSVWKFYLRTAKNSQGPYQIVKGVCDSPVCIDAGRIFATEGDTILFGYFFSKK
jgi:hypothetical protein